MMATRSRSERNSDQPTDDAPIAHRRVTGVPLCTGDVPAFPYVLALTNSPI